MTQVVQSKRPRNDPALIRAAQSGCVEARNRLVEENLGLIRRAVGSIVGSDNVPEYLGDGVQGFMEALSSFNAALGFQLSTYVYRGVQNRAGNARNRNRNRERRRTVNMDDDAWQFVAAPERPRPNERVHHLRACIAQLPERERYVVSACLQGRLQRQVGKDFDRSKERIRQIRARGLERLRNMMLGTEADEGSQ